MKKREPNTQLIEIMDEKFQSNTAIIEKNKPIISMYKEKIAQLELVSDSHTKEKAIKIFSDLKSPLEEESNTAEQDLDIIGKDLAEYTDSKYDGKVEERLLSKYIGIKIKNKEQEQKLENNQKKKPSVLSWCLAIFSTLSLAACIAITQNPNILNQIGNNLGICATPTPGKATDGDADGIEDEELENMPEATPVSQTKSSNLMMVEYLEHQKSVLEEELLNADKVDPQMKRVVNQNYIDYTNEMIKIYKEIPVLDDITNNEQVNKRATYIYEKFVLPIMKAKGLTPNINSNDDIERIASIESIANMISISGTKAPVDANGRKFFEKTEDTDTYTQIMNNKITLVDWFPFDGRSQELYFIPECLFQVDNSDSARFIYQADIEYYNVTANMNNKDSADFIQASRNVGIFQRDTIVQVGMNGGSSIYNVKDAQHSSYNATMMRFVSLNISEHLNGKKAACIYLCLDYSTNEWVLVPVVEVYIDAKAGTFTDPTASMVGDKPNLIAFGNYAFENARNAVEGDYQKYITEMGTSYSYKG